MKVTALIVKKRLSQPTNNIVIFKMSGGKSGGVVHMESPSEQKRL